MSVAIPNVCVDRIVCLLSLSVVAKVNSRYNRWALHRASRIINAHVYKWFNERKEYDGGDNTIVYLKRFLPMSERVNIRRQLEERCVTNMVYPLSVLAYVMSDLSTIVSLDNKLIVPEFVTQLMTYDETRDVLRQLIDSTAFKAYVGVFDLLYSHSGFNSYEYVVQKMFDSASAIYDCAQFDSLNEDAKQKLIASVVQYAIVKCHHFTDKSVSRWSWQTVIDTIAIFEPHTLSGF